MFTFLVCLAAVLVEVTVNKVSQSVVRHDLERSGRLMSSDYWTR